MVTDESFEQVANLDTKHPQYAGNGWTNYTSNDVTEAHGGQVSLRFGDAFSGNVSAKCIFKMVPIKLIILVLPPLWSVAAQEIPHGDNQL